MTRSYVHQEVLGANTLLVQGVRERILLWSLRRDVARPHEGASCSMLLQEILRMERKQPGKLLGFSITMIELYF